MLASLQKHGAGFLREERAAIDARPTLEIIREQMAKRRDQGQTPRVSVVPRATLPSGARQLLDARWREPLQGIGANARIPGGTLLPEVRLEGMNPLAIIRAQMAIGAAQRRHALQLPQSQQAGRVQPPGEQRAGAGAERFEGGRPPADARAHAAEGDGEAAGTGKRPREEARGSRDARAEHARHFNYDWEEGLLGDEGQKKKYGMCSDPASWQAACTATLAAIPEVTSPEAKKLAEEGGYAIDNPLKLAALLHTAVVKLVQALPVKSVIRAAGIKEDDLAEVDAGRVLGYILRRVQTKWRYSTVNNARHGWVRLESWLRDGGTRHEEGNISAMTLNEYFLHCHRQSVGGSDTAWAAKLERWSTAVDKAAAAGTEAPPRPVRRRFGNKGALGQYDALHFLSVNFGMLMPTTGKRPELPEFEGHRQKPPPVPAPPLPLRSIAQIERYATKLSTPPAMKNAATATLFLIFCCCRAEQGQNLQIYGIEHGAIWGQVNCEKGKSKQPRPFWCALEGFFGRSWFDALLETLRGVEDGGFLFRSFAGDPLSFDAKAEWACLPEEGITPRIRLLLQQACEMSVDEAAGYTKHSCRHCMIASAAARGEPFMRQVEIGRWSGGSGDTSDLFGDEYTRAKAAMKVSAMPIRYTARVRPKRLARIMAQQTEAWRALLATVGGQVHRLPGDQAGYGVLAQYDQERDGI